MTKEPLKVAPDTYLGHFQMKKYLVTLSIVMTAYATSFLSVHPALASSSHTETIGAGDGHCTKCGLSNGHYRCPAFYSPSNDTRCACGHSKLNHAYRR